MHDWLICYDVDMKRLIALLIAFTLLAAACNGHDTQSKDQVCNGPWNFSSGYAHPIQNHGDVGSLLEGRFYLDTSSATIVPPQAIGALQIMITLHDPRDDSTFGYTKTWSDFNVEQWYHFQMNANGREVVESSYRFQWKSTVAPLSTRYEWTPWIEYHDTNGSNAYGCAGRNADGN